MIDSDPGVKNNKVVVKKTDFEVFQALDVDSASEDGDDKGICYQQIVNSPIILYFNLYSFIIYLLT